MEKEIKTKNIYEKLSEVQTELKAPKGNFNSFGKYKYRSCEDILEAVKPICKKHEALIVVGDELEVIGERYYVKATARFYDLTTGMTIENTAFAREELDKKGMDGSQITGTASSYARKYALNGLLSIDDTKDADTEENRNEVDNTPIQLATKSQLEKIKELVPDLEAMLEYYKIKTLEELSLKQASEVIKKKEGK